MTRLLLLVPLFLFALSMSCTPPAPGFSGKEGEITYFQDCSTNLCFAYTSYGTYGSWGSTVPCEKVERVLQNHCPAVEQP